MFRMLVHPSSGACDLLWIYFMCCIALVRCVLVLRHGSAGVVWYPYAGFSKWHQVGLSLFNYQDDAWSNKLKIINKHFMYPSLHHKSFYHLRLPFSKMWHYVSWQTSADDRSNCLTLTVCFLCTRLQGVTSCKTVFSTVNGIRTTNLSHVRLLSFAGYNQEDAIFHNFFIFVRSSACLRWFFRP